jgi:polyhydroxybutyrate depolymerase
MPGQRVGLRRFPWAHPHAATRATQVSGGQKSSTLTFGWPVNGRLDTLMTREPNSPERCVTHFRSRPWLFALPLVALLVVTLAFAPGAEGQDPPFIPPFETIPPPPATATPLPKYKSYIAGLSVDRAGCDALPTNVKAGSDTVWTLAGARRREYLVHFPANGKAGQRLPVVLNFHGLAADGKTQFELSQFGPLADKSGFIVVSPDGSGTPRGWDALLKPAGITDDIAFANQLLDKVSQDFCVDADRVYAAGFSNGAMMASRLACRLGNRIAAAGAVAGVYRPGEECGRPVPVVAVHGTTDDTVPFEQGRIIEQTSYPGAHVAISAWAAAGTTCTPTAELFLLSPMVGREQFRGCGRNESLLYIVYGGGHTWPDEVATADVLWAFFRDHPMPKQP